MCLYDVNNLRTLVYFFNQMIVQKIKCIRTKSAFFFFFIVVLFVLTIDNIGRYV